MPRPKRIAAPPPNAAGSTGAQSDAKLRTNATGTTEKPTSASVNATEDLSSIVKKTVARRGRPPLKRMVSSTVDETAPSAVESNHLPNSMPATMSGVAPLTRPTAVSHHKRGAVAVRGRGLSTGSVAAKKASRGVGRPVLLRSGQHVARTSGAAMAPTKYILKSSSAGEEQSDEEGGHDADADGDTKVKREDHTLDIEDAVSGVSLLSAEAEAKNSTSADTSDAMGHIVAALFGWRVEHFGRDGGDRVRMTLVHAVNSNYTVRLEVPISSLLAFSSLQRQSAVSSASSNCSSASGVSSPESSAHSIRINDGAAELSWRECALWLSSQFSSGFAFVTAPPFPLVNLSQRPAPPQKHRDKGTELQAARGRPRTAKATTAKESVTSESSSNEEDDEEDATMHKGSHTATTASTNAATSNDALPQLATTASRPVRKRGRPRKDTPLSDHEVNAVKGSGSSSTATNTSPANETFQEGGSLRDQLAPPQQWEPTSSSTSNAGAEDDDVDHLELLPRRRRTKRERTPATPAPEVPPGASAEAPIEPLPHSPPADGGDAAAPAAVAAMVTPVTLVAPATDVASVVDHSDTFAESREPAATAMETAPVSKAAGSREEGVPAASTAAAAAGAQAAATRNPPLLIPPFGAGHALTPVPSSRLACCLALRDDATSPDNNSNTHWGERFGSAAAFLSFARAENKRIALNLAAVSASPAACMPGSGALSCAPHLLSAMQQLHDGEGELRADMRQSVQQAVATAGLQGDPAYAGVHALQTAAAEERPWSRSAQQQIGHILSQAAPPFPREAPHTFLPVSGAALIQAQDRLTSAVALDAQLRLQAQNSTNQEDDVCEKPRYRVLPAGSTMPVAPRIEIGSTYRARGSVMVAPAPVVVPGAPAPLDASSAAVKTEEEAHGKSSHVASSPAGEQQSSLSQLPALVPNPQSDLHEVVYRRFLPKDFKDPVGPNEGLDAFVSKEGVKHGSDESGSDFDRPRQETEEGQHLPGKKGHSIASNCSDTALNHSGNDSENEKEDAAVEKKSSQQDPPPAPQQPQVDIDKTLRRVDKHIGRVPMADVEWRYQA